MSNQLSDGTRPPLEYDGVTRRSFLRTSAVLASGLAALAASLAPLREWRISPRSSSSCRSTTRR